MEELLESLKPLYWSELNISNAWFCRRAGITYMIVMANTDLYTLLTTDFTGSITYKFNSLEKAQEKANHIMECQMMHYFKFENK